MEDIEQRGLPLYFRSYLKSKLDENIDIDAESFKEVPTDLKKYVDVVVSGEEGVNLSEFAGFPLVIKKEIIEEKEESGGTKPEAPTFDPPAGSYGWSVDVTISAEEETTIMYKLGSGDFIEYTEPITLTENTTITAYASKDGTNSDQSVIEYEVDSTKCAKPVISPSNGEIAVGEQITITCATPGATIYYSNYGSYPDSENGQEYTGPITVTNYDLEKRFFIRAIAVKDGYKESDIKSVCFINSDYDTVAFEDLDNYLKNRTAAKPIELTGLTLENLYGMYNGELDRYGEGGDHEGTLKYIIKQNNKSVDLSRTSLLDLAESDGGALYHVFDGCGTLHAGPIVPNKLYGTFKNMGYGLRGGIEVKYTNEHAVLGEGDDFPFNNAGNLSNVYVDTYIQKEDLCNAILSSNPDSSWTYNVGDRVTIINKDFNPQSVDGVYTASANIARDVLNALPLNSPDAPYRLNLTGTRMDQWTCTADDMAPMGYLLGESRYVDLGPTTLPAGITDMSRAFVDTSYIVGSPSIPNTVTDLGGTFSYSHIYLVPEIPSTVTNLDYTFGYNQSIVTPPTIHINNSVEVKINDLFSGCDNLTTVRFDGMNVKIDVDRWTKVPFDGCSNLETIYVNTEADKTKLYNLCHEIDSSDEYVTLEKIVVDPISA